MTGVGTPVAVHVMVTVEPSDTVTKSRSIVTLGGTSVNTYNTPTYRPLYDIIIIIIIIIIFIIRSRQSSNNKTTHIKYTISKTKRNKHTQHKKLA